MQDYFNRFPAREKQKAGEAWHYIPGLKSRGSEAFSEKWKIIFLQTLRKFQGHAEQPIILLAYMEDNL